MKEFAINDYLVLKLEEGLKYIYVDGEPFNQRIHLIILLYLYKKVIFNLYTHKHFMATFKF